MKTIKRMDIVMTVTAMKGIITRIFILLCFALIIGCNEPTPDTETQLFSFSEIKFFDSQGGEPNLTTDSEGQVYITWIEYINDSTDVLNYALLGKDRSWTLPKKIASGNNWFVNWADFPSLVVHHENKDLLAAHWLQKSAAGTFDYDVRISVSSNSGNSWSESFIIHNDNIAAEHGFVSMLSIENEKFFATWLDGRNTKTGQSDKDHGVHNHGIGAMTLRSAVFDAKGNVSNEIEMDDKVCDCCQTTSTRTSKGIVIAYRDRTDHEIRDISIIRQLQDDWSTPLSIWNDDWEIAGCPVNGPAIDALDNHLAVSWYTASKEMPKVNIAFSKNAGESFSDPIRIDNGKPIGRVDLIMISNSEALVSWVEQYEDEAIIMAGVVNGNAITIESEAIVSIDASRSSGFPRMIRTEQDYLFAWTDVEGEGTHVKTGILRIK